MRVDLDVSLLQLFDYHLPLSETYFVILDIPETELLTFDVHVLDVPFALGFASRGFRPQSEFFLKEHVNVCLLERPFDVLQNPLSLETQNGLMYLLHVCRS